MKKIYHILFVDEIHVDDDSALLQAIELAHSNQAKLTVVGCYENLKKQVNGNQSKASFQLDELITQKHHILNRRVKALSEDLSEDLNVEVKVFTGKPFIDIITEAIEYEADIVIKPVEPTGFKTMLFGSQDLKLLRMCPCPVWLIKSTEEQPEKQIVVAIDYEPDNPENEWVNKELLDYGVSLARTQFAQLHVVHSWLFDTESLIRGPLMQYSEKQVEEMLDEEQQNRNKWLKKSVDDCLSAYGKTTHKYLSPILHLVKGDAAFKIPELVEELNPELLIMGTVARTGIPGFLIGNTAEAVLFNINCSLLAVKPEGFVSPIKVD